MKSRGHPDDEYKKFNEFITDKINKQKLEYGNWLMRKLQKFKWKSFQRRWMGYYRKITTSTIYC